MNICVASAHHHVLIFHLPHLSFFLSRVLITALMFDNKTRAPSYDLSNCALNNADSERDVPEFMSTLDCPKDRLLSKNAETEKELLVQLTNCAVDHIVLHLRCLPHHSVHLPHHCKNVFQEDNSLSENVMTGNALLASFTNMSLSN
jgi:hypothetical protein